MLDWQNTNKKCKGLAIGDGATDPLTMFTGYSDLLYYVGLADEMQV